MFRVSIVVKTLFQSPLPIPKPAAFVRVNGLPGGEHTSIPSTYPRPSCVLNHASGLDVYREVPNVYCEKGREPGRIDEGGQR